MKGYLKGAGVILQCTRCWSLRNVQDDKECPTCRQLLDLIVTEVRWLVLNDISTDIIDADTYGLVSSEQLQGRGTVH